MEFPKSTHFSHSENPGIERQRSLFPQRLSMHLLVVSDHFFLVMMTEFAPRNHAFVATDLKFNGIDLLV